MQQEADSVKRWNVDQTKFLLIKGCGEVIASFIAHDLSYARVGNLIDLRV